MHDFEYGKQSAIVSTASKPCQGKGLCDTVSGQKPNESKFGRTSSKGRKSSSVAIHGNRLLLTRQKVLELFYPSFV